jgi:hypothetical protein
MGVEGMSLNLSCDNCNVDLSDSGPMPRFRMRLVNERMPNKSGFTYAVSVSPIIPVGEYDFCGSECLSKWLAKSRDRRKLGKL